MQLIIGFVFGMLVVAYTPDLGAEIRALTNSAAVEVERATADEAKWEQLYNDTVEALGEKTE